MPQLVFSQDQFKVWASEASGHQRPLGIRHRLLTFPRSDNITEPDALLFSTFLWISHPQRKLLIWKMLKWISSSSPFFSFIFSPAQPNFNFQIALAALKLHVWWLNILLISVLCNLSVTVKEWLPLIIVFHLLEVNEIIWYSSSQSPSSMFPLPSALLTSNNYAVCFSSSEEDKIQKNKWRKQFGHGQCNHTLLVNFLHQIFQKGIFQSDTSEVSVLPTHPSCYEGFHSL